jgi:hypothetical protein
MTNNKQQTAVEWYAKQIEILHYDYFTEHISKDEKNQRLKQLKEQAKEMDKELTIKFALFYAYGQDNVSEQLRTKIEKWYDKIFEGGEQ